MVLPFAGYAEIFAGVAFLLEPGPGEQRAAGKVARQTGRLEPVQPEALEGKVDDERQRRCHIALPRKGLAHPVAQARRLRNAAPNIRKAYAADQVLVMGEDEKIIRLVGAPIFGITPPPAPGFAPPSPVAQASPTTQDVFGAVGKFFKGIFSH